MSLWACEYFATRRKPSKLLLKVSFFCQRTPRFILLNGNSVWLNPTRDPECFSGSHVWRRELDSWWPPVVYTDAPPPPPPPSHVVYNVCPLHWTKRLRLSSDAVPEMHQTQKHVAMFTFSKISMTVAQLIEIIEFTWSRFWRQIRSYCCVIDKARLQSSFISYAAPQPNWT